MLIDLHCHTRPLSACSALDAAELARLARSRGLDAICLTEHDRAWPEDELRELRGRTGFPIFSGVELTTDIGHILAFGLAGTTGYSAIGREVHQAALECGAILFLAHPARDGLLTVSHETVEYFASVDAPARDNNTTAVISTGWDPGLFSINRLIGEAILPEGATYSFWGRGLSQGHSDAVRRVDGVAAGVQYTNPTSDAVARARSGERPELTTREKHTRHCFVVLTDGADADEVEQAIVTMPDYFVDYDTTVTFIDADTLAAEHDAMPHGGVVIRSASTADGHDHTMQFSLELGHNPSFTAGVVVAYARAAHRMNQGGDFGAKTPFDVAPGLLSPRSPEDLRRDLL